MATANDDRTGEAQRILDRAHRESAAVADTLLSRAAGHLKADDAAGQDSTEVWGRRVGRTLGVIAAIALFINLFTHWWF